MDGGNEITRAEFSEFTKRIEESRARTNKRLELLENSVQQIGNLATSVEKLALNMEHLASEQKEQNSKLEKLEGQDGEMWRKVVGYIVTTIVGIIVGFAFKQFGM